MPRFSMQEVGRQLGNMKRNLSRSVPILLEKDDKAILNRKEEVLNSDNQRFENMDQLSQAIDLLGLDYFSEVDLVTPQERTYVMHKILFSSDLITSALKDIDKVSQLIGRIGWIRAKGNSEDQQKIVKECYKIVTPHIIAAAENLMKPETPLQLSKNGFNMKANELQDYIFYLGRGLVEAKDVVDVNKISKLNLNYIKLISREKSWLVSDMNPRECIENIIVYGEDETKLELKQVIEEYLLEHKEGEGFLDWVRILGNWLIGRPTSKAGEIESYKNEILATLLSKYGLDPVSTVNTWLEDDRRNLADYRIRHPKQAEERAKQDYSYVKAGDHLIAVMNLEQERPGICAILNKEFNISFFGRYKKETMLRQLKQISDDRHPYMLFIVAKPDHNNAFISNQYGEMIDSVAQKCGDIRTRIIEVGSKSDLIQYTSKVKTRYGKAILGVIKAHGSSLSVQLSYDQNDDLCVEDLNQAGGYALEALIDEAGSLIFISCDTGKWLGIAQTAAKILKRLTIAPDNVVSLRELRVNMKKPRGKILEPVYSIRNSIKEYAPGD